jgi:hypothetical protein
LFGRELIHFVLGGNSGTSFFVRRPQPLVSKRMRRKRRGLDARGQRGSARSYSQGEFQKVAAFHEISSLAQSRVTGRF